VPVYKNLVYKCDEFSVPHFVGDKHTLKLVCACVCCVHVCAYVSVHVCA